MFKKFIFPLMALVAVGEFWQWLDKWQQHDMPYKLIAGFYHFTFQEVIRFFPKIWNGIENSSLTPYINLNWTLGLILMLMSIYFVAKMAIHIRQVLVIKGVLNKAYIAYLLPLAIAITFYFLSVFLSWLFM
ncbi:hypothetical protein [Shewanella frigidimarina]|uniref:hypothetical protein n=1 Tax=Shewanella frigidimarina TaxID=56812 RepID=UPI003D7A54E4